MQCYLCGEDGADTRDHVVPKNLLPSSDEWPKPRLTLPAHSVCNARYSSDEEYFRDVVIPEAEFFQLSGISAPVKKLNRSLSRVHGKKQRARILRSAQRLEVRSRAGLYIKRGIGVLPNYPRLKNVAQKIGRGIIFHDNSSFVPEGDFFCAGIPVRMVNEEKNKGLRDDNTYWKYMSSDQCIHEMLAPNIAVRRIYVASGSEPPTVICYMGLIILSVYFVCFHDFDFIDSTKVHVFSDSDYWQRSDNQ